MTYAGHGLQIGVTGIGVRPAMTGSKRWLDETTSPTYVRSITLVKHGPLLEIGQYRSRTTGEMDDYGDVEKSDSGMGI